MPTLHEQLKTIVQHGRQAWCWADNACTHQKQTYHMGLTDDVGHILQGVSVLPGIISMTWSVSFTLPVAWPIPLSISFPLTLTRSVPVKHETIVSDATSCKIA